MYFGGASRGGGASFPPLDLVSGVSFIYRYVYIYIYIYIYVYLRSLYSAHWSDGFASAIISCHRKIHPVNRLRRLSKWHTFPVKLKSPRIAEIRKSCTVSKGLGPWGKEHFLPSQSTSCDQIAPSERVAHMPSERMNSPRSAGRMIGPTKKSCNQQTRAVILTQVQRLRREELSSDSETCPVIATSCDRENRSIGVRYAQG